MINMDNQDEDCCIDNIVQVIFHPIEVDQINYSKV